MKSMLVIGLGRFGRHLSIKLAQLGNEVMVIDKDEDRAEAVAPYVVCAQVGDCQDEEVVKSLGVSNFDVCFVCISGAFQSSLEITAILKELGAKCVVSKTDTEKQSKFLQIVGADNVVYMQKDVAQRVAVRYSAKNALDYIELSEDYSIAEIHVPKKWIGKTIKELDIRSKFNVNVIGYKGDDGKIVPVLDANHIFGETEHLLIAGSTKDTIDIASRD